MSKLGLLVIALMVPISSSAFAWHMARQEEPASAPAPSNTQATPAASNINTPPVTHAAPPPVIALPPTALSPMVVDRQDPWNPKQSVQAVSAPKAGLDHSNPWAPHEIIVTETLPHRDLDRSDPWSPDRTL